MNKDFFQSEEFQDILSNYEMSNLLKQPCYLDIDDFADLSDYYLENDRMHDALQALEQGLHIHKGNKSLLTIKAGILVNKHQYKEAQDILDQIPDYQGHETAYIRAQLAYAMEHDSVKAEKLFCQWLANEKKDLKENYDKKEREEILRDDYIHVIMSFIELSSEKDYTEIVKRWCDKYIECFSPLGNYDSDMTLADICREEGMTDYVERVYTLLLDTNPYLESAWSVLAAAQNVNGRFEDSINSADFALAINPEDYDALLTKAHSHYSMNDIDTALPLFQKYIDKTNDESQYLHLGLCHILNENEEEGYEYVKRAQKFYEDQGIENSSMYAAICYEVADAYNTCKHYQEADEAIEKSLSINPDNTDFLLMKGSILLGLEKPSESLHCFIRALDNTADRVRTYIYIGIRFMSFEQYDAAIFMFKQALEEEDNPDHIIAHAYLAYIFFHTQQYEKFLDHLKIACKEAPASVGNLFAEAFPNMKPEEYYDYIIKNKKVLFKDLEKEDNSEE